MPSLRTVLAMSVALCCVAGTSGSLLAQAPAPVPTSPPFPPGNIRPTLLDFITGQPVSYRMQVASTPKMMRPPFANQPIDQPKGLAYVIKAQQVDVKNRVKAVRFLGQQDCMDPGTAKEGEPPKPGATQIVLIKTMESDPSEVVRYEAVKAIENQLTRGPCSNNKVKHVSAKNSRGRFESCLGCCNETVLAALSKRAYDTDAHGCPVEPSARVREAAIHAMTVCGIDCTVGPVPDANFNTNPNGINVEPPVPTAIPVEPTVVPEAQN